MTPDELHHYRVIMQRTHRLRKHNYVTATARVKEEKSLALHIALYNSVFGEKPIVIVEAETRRHA